jgi:hypothetical protein
LGAGWRADGRRARIARRFAARAAALLAVPCALPGLVAASPDAIVLEVDLERHELRAEDGGEPGPRFAIAAGTPTHPTPRGRFVLDELTANPRFRPGPIARAAGARPREASAHGPLGVAKIPFLGSFQLHAGADRLAVGKPLTLGCVALTDGDMRELITWLGERGALGAGARTPSGEVLHRFVRRATLRID